MTLVEAIQTVEALVGTTVPRLIQGGMGPSHLKVIEVMYEEPKRNRYGVGRDDTVEQAREIGEVTSEPRMLEADAIIDSADRSTLAQALKGLGLLDG